MRTKVKLLFIEWAARIIGVLLLIGTGALVFHAVIS
jgi:hypothetical protein